jgi:hypothetical protein
MNDQNLTRLVVGEAFQLSLGIPVGQHTKASADPDSTLRWRKGKWEQHLSLIERVRQLHASKTDTIELKLVSEKLDDVEDQPQPKALALPGVNARLVMAIVGAALLIATTWWLVTQFAGRDTSQQLPIATTAPVTGPVKTVEEAFPFPDARTAPDLPVNVLPSASQSSTGEYIIPPEIKRILDAKPTAGEPPVAAKTNMPQDRPKLPPVQDTKPMDASQKDTKQQSQAVVLDVDTPNHKPVLQPTPVAVTKSEPASKTMPSPVKAVEPAKQGTGLVALTQDGLSALFTNPKNRLPEKFGIGDKIPNGETIKSIDKAAGKVVTDAKEYKLE